MTQPVRTMAHELVAKTAKGIAGVMYEEMMRKDNDAWAEWQRINPDVSRAELEVRFIALAWPHLIEQARATLAKLLRTSLDESLKEQVSEALILDNTLRFGRDKSAGFRLDGLLDSTSLSVKH